MDNWKAHRPKLIIYAPAILPPLNHSRIRIVHPTATFIDQYQRNSLQLAALPTLLLEPPPHEHRFVETRGHSTSTSEIVQPNTGTDRDAHFQPFQHIRNPPFQLKLADVSRQSSRWRAQFDRGYPHGYVRGPQHGLAIASAEAGAMARWHRPLTAATALLNHHTAPHLPKRTRDFQYPGRGPKPSDLTLPPPNRPHRLRRNSPCPRCCSLPRPPDRRQYTRYTSLEMTRDQDS